MNYLTLPHDSWTWRPGSVARKMVYFPRACGNYQEVGDE